MVKGDFFRTLNLSTVNSVSNIESNSVANAQKQIQYTASILALKKALDVEKMIGRQMINLINQSGVSAGGVSIYV